MDLPLRREPPHFRRVQVASLQARSPHLTRVTLRGPELEGLDPGLPAASVRLLLPRDGAGPLEVPDWNGNEFLYVDGSRPPIRTLTPLQLDPTGPELQVEVVRHGAGALSQWADAAQPGDEIAVSGTGRGFEVPDGLDRLVLVGDESALPAITTIVPATPPTTHLVVRIEVTSADAQVELPDRAGMDVSWSVLPAGAGPGDSMLEAVRGLRLDDRVHVWAAGEAAAVQRLRRHLFDEVGLSRSATTVRGYWKLGRAGAGS